MLFLMNSLMIMTSMLNIFILIWTIVTGQELVCRPFIAVEEKPTSQKWIGIPSHGLLRI